MHSIILCRSFRFLKMFSDDNIITQLFGFVNQKNKKILPRFQKSVVYINEREKRSLRSVSLGGCPYGMQTKEKQLAAKLKKGDTAALKEIIDHYTGYVRTVIRNFSRGTFSEQDVDELCSDVFYSLWQHRETLDAKIGFRSYLSAIARNAVKDRFKSAKPHIENIEDLSEPEIPDGFSVEDAAQLHEMMRCLDKGLEELSEQEREIFARYYFYGESTPQIAKKLNLAEGVVRSKLSRTRNKLKNYLTERGFEYA